MIKLKAYNINLDNANDEIDELEGKVSKLEEALSYFKELWRKFIEFLQDKFFSSNKYDDFERQMCYNKFIGGNFLQYSDEFKQKVLSTLGDSEEMRKRLDEGQEIVGRYLDDSRYGGISAKEIVEACEQMNYQGIYQKAKRQLALDALYGEWIEMYRNQNKMHR